MLSTLQQPYVFRLRLAGHRDWHWLPYVFSAFGAHLLTLVKRHQNASLAIRGLRLGFLPNYIVYKSCIVSGLAGVCLAGDHWIAMAFANVGW